MELVTEDIVGYPVCCAPLDQVLDKVVEIIRSGTRTCRYFSCLNPHSIEVAAQDPAFRAALKEADFLTADGIGIVYVSRLFGGAIRRRITGTDVFMHVNRVLDEEGGGTCFLLGSTETTLARMRERMAIDFPGVEVAGAYSPPFKPAFEVAETDEMVARINDVQPDVLWVGMTAPKQEKWIHQNRSRLRAGFAGPIGAVFDFYAGNVKRAGPAWQALGLEWLPRLMQEPRRLWRRNFISAPCFLARSVKYHLLQSRVSSNGQTS